MGQTASRKKKKHAGRAKLLPVGAERTVRCDSLKLDPENTLKPIETLRGRGYRFALERNQVD